MARSAAAVLALALATAVGVAAAGITSHAQIQRAAAGESLVSGVSRVEIAPHPRIFLDPATIAGLRARAASNSPEWLALKAECDQFLTGTVEWPDGDNYPDGGSIGAGYQGDGYIGPMMDAGLCYQTEATSKPGLAAQYAAKGADILTKMTAPSGDHAPDPLRDDGYGIRFYVVSMALGYDWLYPALGSALKSRIITAMHRWINAYEAGGFEHDFPQGNYFAGYYDAKALAGLAVEGDDSNSPLSDFLGRVHATMVQPFYAANLSGGGWPEGWNYGPFGVLNMSWPALAVKTALGTDLVHSQAAPYLFPLNSAKFLLYFTWPDLKTQEDSDLVYDSDNPTPTHPWLVTFESALLHDFGDSFAPYFQSYARAVRAIQPEEDFYPPWYAAINFLFWNDAAPAKDYQKLPRSYVAHGVEMASTRSSWGKNAVWAAFKSGPYTNYQDNGEEFGDQGSLSIVNGSRPFLVNAWGALVRDTHGTNDGSSLWNQAYNNVFSGKRNLFNVFYIGGSSPGQGAYLRSDGARTAIDRFGDFGSYVDMRGVHLEDAYPRDQGNPKQIKSWTREVVYVRPGLFVVFDRTQVARPGLAERMDFHFQGKLERRGPGRYDAGTGATYAGTVQTVLPRHARDSIVNVFGSNKVYRLEVRPPEDSPNIQWLTVLDAGASASAAYSGQPVETSGGTAVRLSAGSSRYVVIQATAPTISYDAPAAQAKDIITGLVPSAGYTVAISGDAVSVSSGGTTKATSAGTISFRTAGP